MVRYVVAKWKASVSAPLSLSGREPERKVVEEITFFVFSPSKQRRAK